MTESDPRLWTGSRENHTINDRSVFVILNDCDFSTLSRCTLAYGSSPGVPQTPGFAFTAVLWPHHAWMSNTFFNFVSSTHARHFRTQQRRLYPERWFGFVVLDFYARFFSCRIASEYGSALLRAWGFCKLGRRKKIEILYTI